MKKLLLFLFVSLVLISVVSASDYLPHQQNNSFDLIVSSNNATSCNWTYIQYSGGSKVYYNKAMTQTGIDFNYLIDGGNFSNLGYVCMGISCTDGSTYQPGSICREVTKNGEEPFGENLIIFVFIIFIFAALGLIATMFLNLAKLVMANETLYGVLVSWSFYILMIIINYLGKNYITSNFVEDLSGLFITITNWTNGFLPILALIITMFIKGTQKKKPIPIQEFAGRGLMKYAE